MEIDCNLLSQMIISAANNLKNNKDEIDRLNVFPVPDGDTGKNMFLTMQGAAEVAEKNTDTNPITFSEKIASATLKSARGNSGVILSQLFRGLSKGIVEKGEFTPQSWAFALKQASDSAYRAVMKPTEGTILTVAMECAAGANASLTSAKTITDVTKAALDNAKIALKKTQDMLPKLKEAGVVDAGGMGWVCIIEGMYSVLSSGKIIEPNEEDVQITADDTMKVGTLEEITYGYCTEFIIEKKELSLGVDNLRKSLETIGDSMLVIEDFDVIKVHVHTDNPGVALQEALKLGSLINIKIDNMRHQHSENIKEEVKPKKKYGILTISSGEGFSEIFKELGVGTIIEGGQTMNPSAGDIAEGILKENAEVVYVLPNNKNIILAAAQSKDMVDCRVEIIPTTTIPQGISAVISFNPDSEIEENVTSMTESANLVKTGLVTYAVRDSESDGLVIEKGNILGLCDEGIIATGKNTTDITLEVCDYICDCDSCVVTLYYGSDVSSEEAETMLSILEDKFSDYDVSLQYGGQPVYYYIISAE